MAAPKLRFKEFDGEWTLSELDDHIHESKASSKIQDEYEVLTSSRRGLIRQADYFENSRLTDRENIGFNIIEPDQITYRSRSDDGFFFFNLNGLGITGIISTYYPVFTMKKGNNWFLNELLNYHKYKYIQYAVGTSQLVLSLNQLRKIKFNIPCLDEQTKIASFLSAVDEKISQLTQKHALLSQYKQGMMQKLFSQQIRFKADDGSEFGEWEERKLGEVCRFVNGRAYKQTEWEKEGTPVIRLQNLTGSGKEYYYSNLNLPDHQYCYNNDLLYMWSATFGPVFWQGEKAIFHYHIWKIEVNPQLLDKKYMYFLLDEMTEKMKRSLNGSTMLHVTKQGMENTEKIIPSLPEQTKIANFLSAIDQKIEVVVQQIEQAKQWKKGLLQQMFV